MTNDELKILEEVVLFANGKVFTQHMNSQVKKALFIIKRDLSMKQLEKDIPFLDKEHEEL